jgi:pyrroloquinoline quinone biosynthesis protein B
VRIRLLGTAAGGALPQWNCGCDNCRLAREGKIPRRMQTSAAVSADGEHWFLLEASPDLRWQIESFPPLGPPPGRRGTGVDGVLLTNADLDHVLGIWSIREGGPLWIHATPAVRSSLSEGLGLDRALSFFAGCQWFEVPADPRPLLRSNGTPSGLLYSGFPLPGKAPRYVAARPGAPGDNIALRIEDPRTGGRLIFAPDIGAVGPTLLEQLGACDVAFLDGTFWTEGELERLGGRNATAMAHLPLGGPGGSLAAFPRGRKPRRIFVHINNSNPMLREDSPERSEVLRSGAEVGTDGQELEL